MIQTPNNLRRRGFTFAEILFAVMILGIGFIMIAGVFPVALQQAQLTRADAAAAAISESASRWLSNNSNVLHTDDFPTTAGYFFGPPLLTPGHPPDNLSTWEHLRGNLIIKSDPRYAWVPVIFREQNASEAIVFLFVCESQLDASFINADVNTTTSLKCTLYPRVATVTQLAAAKPLLGQLADRITFKQQNATDPSPNMLATGAYVVVKRSDKTFPNIYRLGNPVDPTLSTPLEWELMPGHDLAGDVDLTNATLPAYMIGRRNITPDLNQNSFTGPPQDIGIYQTTIHLTSEHGNQ